MFGAARMCGTKSMDKEKFVKRNRMWDEFTLQSLCYVDLGEYGIARKCTFTITLCYLKSIRVAIKREGPFIHEIYLLISNEIVYAKQLREKKYFKRI